MRSRAIRSARGRGRRRARQQWRRRLCGGARAGRARLSGARDAARRPSRRCAAMPPRRRGCGRARSRPPHRSALAGAGVIVDALFGAGLNRAVEGAARAMIEAMNASGAPIVAVDLPSGINGASGAVMGAAVKARESVTFFRRKPGHRAAARTAARRKRARRRHRHSGQRAGAGAAADLRQRASAVGQRFPIPRLDGHKYSRGHAVVVSGDLSFTGAARLAARGALRAGAGLVTLASPRAALAVNAAASLAVMVRAVDGADELARAARRPRASTRSCSARASGSARTRAIS